MLELALCAFTTVDVCLVGGVGVLMSVLSAAILLVAEFAVVSVRC